MTDKYIGEFTIEDLIAACLYCGGDWEYGQCNENCMFYKKHTGSDLCHDLVLYHAAEALKSLNT